MKDKEKCDRCKLAMRGNDLTIPKFFKSKNVCKNCFGILKEQSSTKRHSVRVGRPIKSWMDKLISK